MIYNCAPPEKHKTNIDKDVEYHLKIIRETGPEMIGIYDIIEEKTRNGKPRPYESREHMNAYAFAGLLQSKLPDKSFIVYRSVKLSETYDDIVNDVKQHQSVFPRIVVIGNSANPLVNTNKLIARIVAECSVAVGCVLLPERRNEMEICLERVRMGASFFISQIIVDPEYIRPFIDALPVRVWTTVVPLETEKHVEMFNWLNGTNYSVDLTTYPQTLIQARFKDVCFETISYIPSNRVIAFVKRFE
jgi:hypothetical protein